MNELKSKRLNKSCSMVMRLLKSIDHLVTAREIHELLKTDHEDLTPGLTTIYRCIEILQKLDLIQTVDLGDGEKRYERIEPGEHHHHLICTSCKASIHLDRCFIDTMTTRIEEMYGYMVRSHVMELFGTCPRCKANSLKA
jgi:Fur family ferric uptake transcriptional regulator